MTAERRREYNDAWWMHPAVCTCIECRDMIHEGEDEIRSGVRRAFRGRPADTFFDGDHH